MKPALRRSRLAALAALVLGVAPIAGGCGDVVRVTSSGAADASIDGGRAAAGQALVVKKGCMDCHQQDLAGSPIPRLGTQAYPANLTPDVETGLGSWTDDQIVRAMTLGIDKNLQPLCFTMPRFKSLDVDQQYDIAIYLRTIPAVSQKIPASTCPPLKPMPDAGSEDATGDAALDDDAASGDSGLDADPTD